MAEVAREVTCVVGVCDHWFALCRRGLRPRFAAGIPEALASQRPAPIRGPLPPRDHLMPSNALPPGPKGTLIGGNLREFSAHRLDFFLEVAREYGDIASFRFGPRRVFLVERSRPHRAGPGHRREALHQALRRTRTTSRSWATASSPARATSGFASGGWPSPRSSSTACSSYAPVMSDLAERMLARWQPGMAVDIHCEFSSLTSAIALKTLFGLDDPGDRETVRRDAAPRIRPARRALPLARQDSACGCRRPRNRRIKRAIAELYRVVDGFIAAGRARKEPGDDLLSRLVAARDEDGSRDDRPSNCATRP